MKSVLLIGEPMGLFIANSIGELEDVDNFTLTTCGAEFNVAVGMKRLDNDVTYMTKLGDDPFGRKIVKMMDAVGISTEEILYSNAAPTGFMFKQKVEKGDPGIFYFRKGSAASTLNSEDIQELDFSKFDMVHCTGILSALTDNCRQTVDVLCNKAKKNGCLFSFDPNIRLQLWKSTDVMSKYMNDMAAKSDIFMPGINEVKIILGQEAPEEAAKKYLDMGTKTVIIKVGAKGAYFATETGESGWVKGFKVDQIMDTVGAGDGFAVGVLSALREGLSIKEAVLRGNAIGAIQVMSKGDNDGLPYRDELNAFMKGEKNWRRGC